MLTGPAPSPTPLRVRLTVAVVVGATLLLAGCSDGSGPSAASTSSSTPTAAGTPTAPTVETPPAAPAPARGRAGEQAFARHVMDLWGYALRTNDAKPLSSLTAGPKPCDGCAALTRELARRHSQGWTVDFPGLSVRRVSLTKQGDVTVARAVVDIRESDSYNADGTYRNTNPAHPGANFEVRMRFTGKHYRLVSFTVS